MERLSKEEQLERQREERTRRSAAAFASAAADDDGGREMLRRHFAQQQQRLFVIEHDTRNGLVAAEHSAWTSGIAHPWRYSDVSVVIQLRAVEASEQTWRAAVVRETNLTMERVFKILNRVFEEAVAQLAKADGESGDMKALRLEERELRRRVEEQYSGAAAVAVLAAVEPEEKAWRRVLFREYADAARTIWSRLLGARFLWLLSPAGGAGGVLSEAESRTRILRQEWFSRASAAVRFCQLQLQWHEEWQRMTRLFVEKLNFQYTRLAFRIVQDEMSERRALRSVYEPLSADIREQLEEEMQRRRRVQNKLTALKNLRSVELARASAARFESDDYVAVWRARELAEIEALHSQILGSVASFYTGGKAGSAVAASESGGNGGGVDALGDALGAQRIRGSVEESPELQKLRAFAASASPDRDRRGNNSNSNSNSNNVHVNSSQSMLKLDQALIDLHRHHEDVLQRLSAPTTSFDDIVQYRKQLQSKSGPKLSAAALVEVKQLKGVLNAEIAQIQKQSVLRSGRRAASGGASTVLGFGSGAAVADALLNQPTAAGATPAASALTARTIQMHQDAAAAAAAPSPSPVRAQLQPFVRGGYDDDDDDTARRGQRYGAAASAIVSSSVYDDMLADDRPRQQQQQQRPASDSMSLDAIRNWCLSTARELSPRS